MSSDPTSTQGQTGSSADDLPNFGPAISSLQSFAGSFQDQLDRINNLPAMHDGARWVQLSTRVDGHENQLKAVQDAVTVTRGDFTTLQNEVNKIRGDVTRLQGQFATFQGQFTAFQNVVAGLGNDTTRIQGNVTLLTENARLLGEGLGEQIGAVSESTDHLTNLMNNQAGVITRLEALNKNTVARFHNRRLYGSGSEELESLYCLATGRVIEDVTSRAQLRYLSSRRMTEILSELGEPPQASVRGRRRELKKLYGADLLLLRVVGEEEDSD
ncbi:hypothetical protein E4U32_006337 [Claviceps aff. humidiphila group G2b]|nr:hypothetical protein E4U32_006337 [Claviceps aff. humidiphila group G2b]